MNQTHSVMARIDGEYVRFSPDEYALFMALWNARGGYRTRDELYEYLGSANDAEDPPQDSAIFVHMAEMRKKLALTRFRIPVGIKLRGYRLLRLPVDR